MAETFTGAKRSLTALLQDQDNKVIALTGKWGTGKTHLWRDIAEETLGVAEAIRQPIYVSLFGARTINDLKLRILQNAYAKDAASAMEIFKTSGGIFKDALKKLTGFSVDGAALGAALIWFQSLVKNRLIVIDDVERKHKSLDIDELLGFLEEHSETHHTRFLILLNTDMLADNQEMWARLHEKVIDAEVVLDPTVVECFEIAANGNASPYLPVARDAIVTLNINNIRVIERILKTMQRIYSVVEGIGKISAVRWVPSTALLTACHYRAIDNAPPFEYLQSFNKWVHLLDDKKNERPPQEKEWDLLLDKMGIHAADAYEEIAQQFLKSGILDLDRLTALVKGYMQEEEHAQAFAKRSEFFNAFFWDAHRCEADLVVMAKELLTCVDAYGPDSITDIVSVLEKLGEHALARHALDLWINYVESSPKYQQMNDVPFDVNLREYHPDVANKMNAMRARQHPPLTVIETADRIVMNSAWGHRERDSLANSTIQVYEDSLKQITGDQLRRFLSINLEWAKRPIPYDESFRVGTENFLAACFNLYSSDPNSRLSKIIYRTFEGNGLAMRLKPDRPT